MERNVWRKSSRSGNNGACVEVCDQGEQVAVRDSKQPEGGLLTFGAEAWREFVEGVKGGEFDWRG